MGKLTALVEGKTVAFDTAPLIYYIEEHPDYLAVVDELFESVDHGTSKGLTSVLTLHEVLVKPLREGHQDLARHYRELLTNSANVTVHDVSRSICEIAATLRAKHEWLRAPDALQIATAIAHNAEIIVTNDQRWLGPTEIEVALLKDFLA